jgi:deoxyribodipyrimidine photo-lyase
VSSPYGIHWFRRDLRVHGNPALDRNLLLHGGRVLGVFSFDKKFLARPDFSANRFLFFLRTLETLRDEMRARGGDLLFLDVGPADAFPALLGALRNQKDLGPPKAISWNRDYEPFARERDLTMQDLFEDSFGIETLTERDHLLIEPTELSKGDSKIPGGGFYQVYTPFKNKWFAQCRTADLNSRMREVARGLKAGAPEFSLRWPKKSASFPFGGEGVIESYIAETRKRVPPELQSGGPKPGHAAAKELLRGFRDEAIATYGTLRDIPSVSGTSKMSIYLKNGSITVPQIIALLKLTPDSPPDSVKYLQELVWREFYYHILYHRPNVEHETFLEKYRELAWENNPKWFRAWCEGRTGYPIVDAGMRQLNETGWMHNRVRMIVASFLTKDLLVDYRWGEKYFMEKLLDGDLAPNNGGWQWAASTGCDPQPYFRIFNPTSQGEKFDPDGKYVRRWVPELADRPERELHDPLRPIVDHAKQRERALALFKSARGA